jgi:hypothetical protein
MALTTLAEVKAYLGIAPGDTSQDAIIEIIRPAMEELVIAFCDSDFEEKTIAGPPGEIHDGIDADIIVPYNFPITEITAVFLGCNVKGEDGTELEDDEYYVDTDGSVILRTRTTPFTRGAVRIDYKYGYAAVPATVKLCIYQCVKAELQRRKRNSEDISSRSKATDGGSESEGYGSAWDKKTGLPIQIMSMLESFRSREFPHAGNAQRNQ